jgi:tetratricopeptide (TPR) repeat protein
LIRTKRIYIVATLRSDYYARYQEFPELVELTKPQAQFDLRPPSSSELGDIIRKPAEAAGLRFESHPDSGQRLDEALRDAAREHPESLPLLEHVLEQLFKAHQSRGDDLLRWSDYEAIDGLEGALAKHAESIYQELEPDEQEAFPAVMRQLVTLGQETPNRRTAPYRDFSRITASSCWPTHPIGSSALGKTEAGETPTQRVVDRFVESRLLIADTYADGEKMVSVAHEALLSRKWVRVREWLDRESDFLRMRDRLDADVIRWEQARGEDKRNRLLHKGPEFNAAMKAMNDGYLSLEEVAFVLASAKAIELDRRSNERRRRTLKTGLVLVSILIVVFVVLYISKPSKPDAAPSQAEQRHGAEAAPFETFSKKEQAYLDRMPKDESVRLWEQAILLDNRGDIQLAQGKLNEAFADLKLSWSTFHKLLEADSTNINLRRDLIVSHGRAGHCLVVLGGSSNLQTAQRLLKQALDYLDSYSGPDKQQLQDWLNQMNQAAKSGEEAE